jgi:N-acetylmuramoyl-L-alanine amidase
LKVGDEGKGHCKSLKEFNQMNSMQRNTLLSWWFIVVFLFLFSNKAEAEEITLRYSHQEETVRIVLQTETERYVDKAKVRSSYSLIKIEFPGDFVLKEAPRGVTTFEFSKKGTSLYLNIKNLKWIKVLRLKSPPRLVIDAYLYGKLPEAPPAPSVEKEVPAQPRVKERLKRIVIDPGHGGTDIGIFSPTFAEKKVVLKIARKLKRLLSDRKVYLTRTDDRYMGIMDRVFYIRKKKADLLISMHITMSNYISIYTVSKRYFKDKNPYLLSSSQYNYADESMELSRLLGEHLRKELNLNVYYREMLLPLLSYVNCPAILIELPSGDFFEYNQKNIKRLAEAIRKGIMDYEGS